MDRWRRLTTALRARCLVGLLGVAYVAVAAGLVVVGIVTDAPPTNVVVVTLLIALPGLLLVYGGYRLSESEVRPEFLPDVAAWCLGGFVTMSVILGIYHLQPEGGISSPFTTPPILTALGSFAGFVVGVYDGKAKTRTRELERRNRELQQTRAELEATVDRLDEVNERLERSNERLESFAYAVSHDLQEPLRMVSSYLQLLAERHGDDLDEEGEEYLEFAVDGADRMREMIDGLLEYSRIETQGRPFEPVDLDGVLDDVLDDLRVKIEEHDARITADRLPRVEGDRSQLRQLLQNLLDNAIEYGGDDPPSIHVSAEREGEAWTVAVEDDGIGIDPDHQDRVFDVFDRLHTREEHEGLGIGLALCERIVERHGGDIWVESDPGEGSTFYFTVPAAEESSRDRAAQPSTLR